MNQINRKLAKSSRLSQWIWMEGIRLRRDHNDLTPNQRAQIRHAIKMATSSMRNLDAEIRPIWDNLPELDENCIEWLA